MILPKTFSARRLGAAIPAIPLALALALLALAGPPTAPARALAAPAAGTEPADAAGWLLDDCLGAFLDGVEPRFEGFESTPPLGHDGEAAWIAPGRDLIVILRRGPEGLPRCELALTHHPDPAAYGDAFARRIAQETAAGTFVALPRCPGEGQVIHGAWSTPRPVRQDLYLRAIDIEVTSARARIIWLDETPDSPADACDPLSAEE